MATTNPSLAQRISKYAVSLTYADLTDHAIHTAKQRLVDSIGCALGAWEAQPVVNARNLSSIYPNNASTIFGTTRKTTDDMATFVNGTMVRYFDFNDGFIAKEMAHPSDTIPACIAVAEAEGASGKDLILAIVMAYEIQCRFVEAANLYERGWDHVNYVLVGVVVAVGKLMSLDEVKMTEAINIAINGHIALRQVRAGRLSAWKGSSAANASRNAIFAAQAARCGMEGPSPIFEGEMGFMKQITGPFEMKPEIFGNGVNKDFIICRTLTKLFATQGEMHTAVLAALELRKKIPDLAQVESVHVESTAVGYTILGKDPEKWTPTTRETADHSLPYTVARGLLDGEITPWSYTNEKIHDPLVLELMQNIKVSEDPELTALFPEFIPNRVTVTLKNGEVLSEQKNCMVGGGQEPMTDEHFESKYHKLIEPYLSLERREMLLEKLWNVDKEECLAIVLELMVIFQDQ